MKRKIIYTFLMLFIFSLAGYNNVFGKNKIDLEKINVASNKQWKIKFNRKLDVSTINKGVTVVDSKGNNIDVQTEVQDNTLIVKCPKQGYKSGETYFIKMNNNLKSVKKSFLDKDYILKFTIEKQEKFKLGDDRLLTEYNYLIDGKRVGLVTNQTGVNSQGKSMIDELANYKKAEFNALYGPEHGINGQASAGDYVKSYIDEKLKIPVYSLYNDTRMPTEDMLQGIDVLVFDIQDIGARSYTYMSTLNYCMTAAAKYNKQIIVLDRPNPLGGEIMDGPILEDKYKTFVGVDNLPMTHGMTAGELAKFFNRKINAELVVVPMNGYKRNMIFQDTGLDWVQSSPYIPNITSVFCYNATGLGEGTGIFQRDYFKWVGGKGIDSDNFASLLNNANLPGVTFIPEGTPSAGGVRLKVTDYHTFNPAKTGIYVLAYAHSLNRFEVPKSGERIIMFDKIMGTDMIGKYLEEGYTPQHIEEKYRVELEKFKEERKKYLIYN
ncbi:DUF1343 domain-containing protein [Clostridium aestuarii]|uniref:DUF1343 domain-containing protein n=1 Tax=Clostridium aestuarii TaxID=338193 RepID=A0ABT4CZ63_9CLOT|nr:exo-beta-N-acetylmuramidase NamZ domain-containing protein [Clostridium aestuarii]MCY6483098.1 DUF1343 domain-containing protein [Clostridium aestuarii]